MSKKLAEKTRRTVTFDDLYDAGCGLDAVLDTVDRLRLVVAAMEHFEKSDGGHDPAFDVACEALREHADKLAKQAVQNAGPVAKALALAEDAVPVLPGRLPLHEQDECPHSIHWGRQLIQKEEP